jgi:hypothetical protein
MTDQMFCPKCGKSEQQSNSYCRSCGTFLPDFDKIRTRGFSSKTPEENIKTSLFLNAFSSFVSFIMAILLYATFLGKDDAHPLIYISAAFFLVTGTWQLINLLTGLRLRKQILKRRGKDKEAEAGKLTGESVEKQNLLNEPDFENIVPTSITEQTTTKLPEKTKANSP